jgi:TonB family protein
VKQITGLAFTLALCFGTLCAAFAQTGPSVGTAKNDVVVVSLLRPFYPPLARQAAITGDVVLKLEVLRDGSLRSAVVVSGHPMLTGAALKSAQQSRYECRRCEDEVATQSFTYSFQLVASPGWPCPEDRGVRVAQSGNRVTVTAEPAMVDPYFSSVKVRSAKCLYLWRCGSQWGGEDYYFYRVRSAKCLGLWNCGHRLREPFATCKKLHRTIVD